MWQEGLCRNWQGSRVGTLCSWKQEEERLPPKSGETKLRVCLRGWVAGRVAVQQVLQGAYSPHAQRWRSDGAGMRPEPLCRGTPPCFAKGLFMPLGFEERPTLVPVFSNGKEYNEDFHLLKKKVTQLLKTLRREVNEILK